MPDCEYVQILTFCEGACSFFQRRVTSTAARAVTVAAMETCVTAGRAAESVAEVEATSGDEPFADIAATCRARIDARGEAAAAI